ncbi:plasmid partitioning protein ParB [Rhodovulum sulfidophilum]|uniref:Plasmid partitioning protein ParB n=1 Tax=Rhodovulum sulfidophilum TaxID=35806 RepID=A0A0D6AZI1_RHOSU|nr:plasmid partitioning protein ParB [Rhodovulum sulfidophilum]
MADEATAPDIARDAEPDWILKFSIKGGDTVEWVAAKSTVFGALEELNKRECETGPVGWFFLPLGAINMSEVRYVSIHPRPLETKPDPKPARRARFTWA